jgi:hypothetical protein
MTISMKRGNKIKRIKIKVKRLHLRALKKVPKSQMVALGRQRQVLERMGVERTLAQKRREVQESKKKVLHKKDLRKMVAVRMRKTQVVKKVEAVLNKVVEKKNHPLRKRRKRRNVSQNWTKIKL